MTDLENKRQTFTYITEIIYRKWVLEAIPARGKAAAA
jgi:hypothetical protein